MIYLLSSYLVLFSAGGVALPIAGKVGQHVAKLQNRLAATVKQGSALTGVLAMCVLTSCDQAGQLAELVETDGPTTVITSSPAQYDAMRGNLVTFRATGVALNANSDQVVDFKPATLIVSRRAYGDFVIDIETDSNSERIYAVTGKDYLKGEWPHWRPTFEIYNRFGSGKEKIGEGYLSSTDEYMDFTVKDPRGAGYPDRTVSLKIKHPTVTASGDVVSYIDLSSTGAYFGARQGVRLKAGLYFDAADSARRATNPSGYGFSSYSSGIGPLGADTSNLRLASFQSDKAFVDWHEENGARETIPGIEFSYTATSDGRDDVWDVNIQLQSDRGSLSIDAHVRGHPATDASYDYLIYDGTGSDAKIIGEAFTIDGPLDGNGHYELDYQEKATILFSIRPEEETNGYRMHFGVYAKTGVDEQRIPFQIMGATVNESLRLSIDESSVVTKGILLRAQ